MGADHDLFVHMPEAPSSSPEMQDVAIKRALEQFDRNNIAHLQGSARDARLMWRTAPPLRPSHGRPVMPQMRRLIAASLVCLLAGSSTYLYFAHSPDHRLRRAASRCPPLAASENASQGRCAPDRNRLAPAPQIVEIDRQATTPVASSGAACCSASGNRVQAGTAVARSIAGRPADRSLSQEYQRRAVLRGAG